MPPEVLQELDLAQGALGQDLLAEYIGDLLDSNTLVGLVVDSGARSSEGVVSLQDVPRISGRKLDRNSPDNTVGSLTQFLGNGVPLVHDEVLVEHLEGFTAL